MAQATPVVAANSIDSENLTDETAKPMDADGRASGSTGDAPPNGGRRKEPTCVIVLGMAGSGKTTWMQRFNATLHMKVKELPPLVSIAVAVSASISFSLCV